jgi:hypothetical protein
VPRWGSINPIRRFPFNLNTKKNNNERDTKIEQEKTTGRGRGKEEEEEEKNSEKKKKIPPMANEEQNIPKGYAASTTPMRNGSKRQFV